MEQLQKWEQKLQAGLEALRQQQAELAARIYRQEGAMMLLQEMIRQAEEATTETPAPPVE